MPALRERLERYRPVLRPAAAALAALVLLWAGARWVHAPLVRVRAEAEERLADRRREAAELRALYQERGELERRLEQLQGRLEAIRAGLEQGRRQPSFLRYLEEGARTAGVAVTALAFGEPEAVGDSGYRRYPATLQVLGPYPGLVLLVDRLARAAPFVVVDALDATALQPEGLPDGWVTATVELTLLGHAEGTTAWDRELSDWGLGPGRANPFARPAGGE